MSHSGRVQIFINPHIGEKMLPKIKCAFGVSRNAEIRYDNSLHYKCFLDDEWRKDNG